MGKKEVQIAAGKKAAISRKYNKKINQATSPAQAAAFKAVKTRMLKAIS